MPHHKEQKIIVDKTMETRSQEIADMINEGGLGSDEYYVIFKQQYDLNQQETGNTNHPA
ncbi:hypothetical protein [Oceanobacillus alkalisoli]|uniref:hypothetical protein n=1 Tax=Oceanobacillus alkalisoli TaxID=2925113 RepID=UPI001EF12C6A|nr:hypothetical protein [Oceanobacillus alkalisoli]MCF3944711.1 hypothetical protein [Oceanobacillus alkalisoli]MCG5105073.1 hypothetical protein [Oceanobacillus alkalisoli]